jgi:hypothetical protein
MSAGHKFSGDKLLFLGAAVIFILSCNWIRVRQADIRHLRQWPLPSVRTGSAYRPEKWPMPDATSRSWPGPPTPAAGSGWNYEVFTPPPIYSNADATEFSVAAPLPTGASPSELEGELLAVKPEPFRLQLMGYVGGPGSYRGVFVRPGQPGTLLIREGQDLPELGLTLLRLMVKNNTGLIGGPTRAQAILRDARCGENVVLDCRSIRHTGALLAVLRSAGERQPRECREGDNWSSSGVAYRIERIQLDPPLIALTRSGPDQLHPERKVLLPVSADHRPGTIIANASASSPGSRPAGLATDHD